MLAKAEASKTCGDSGADTSSDDDVVSKTATNFRDCGKRRHRSQREVGGPEEIFDHLKADSSDRSSKKSNRRQRKANTPSSQGHIITKLSVAQIKRGALSCMQSQRLRDSEVPVARSKSNSPRACRTKESSSGRVVKQFLIEKPGEACKATYFRGRGQSCLDEEHYKTKVNGRVDPSLVGATITPRRESARQSRQQAAKEHVHQGRSSGESCPVSLASQYPYMSKLPWWAEDVPTPQPRRYAIQLSPLLGLLSHMLL